MINKEDIQAYYDLIDHKETELRSIEYYKENNNIKSRISEVTHTNNFEDFLSFCQKWEESANIYAGIHERKENGSKTKDVKSIKIIPLDIDANHPRTEAATEKELQESKTVCDQIITDFKEKYGNPTVVMTGNGYQILWKIPEIQINDDNREKIAKKLHTFTKNIQKKYSGDKATIDQIGDLPRILKIPGTTSVKGENTETRPWRRAEITQFNNTPNKNLRDDILMIETKEPKKTTTNTGTQPTDDKLTHVLQKDQKFKELYDGLRQGYPSRSEAEMALACKSVYYGFDVDTILSQSNIGKWNTAHKQYKKLTEKKAYQEITDRFAWTPEINTPQPEIHVKKTPIITKNEVLPQVTEDLLQNKNFIYDENSRLWCYHEKEGIWREDGEIQINAHIRNNIDGEEAQRTYVINEAISRIKGLTYTAKEFPTAPKNYIPFNNCVYDLKTKKTTDFRPDMYLTSKIKTNLDEKNKTCEKIDKFIQEVVDESNKIKIYEWIAYSLYRGYPYQKFLALYGSGLNGKGSFLRIMGKLLGKKNISSESLQDIEKKDFSAGMLWEKQANLCGDMPYGHLPETNILKKLTGGDLLTCNRKHKKQFSFTNYAKIIFSTNELPQTPDQSTAFYRRVALIEFPNDFSKTEKREIETTLTTKEEMSGLAWKSIERLQKLYDNNFQFTENETIEETAKKYEELSNPILKAVWEHFKKDYDQHVFAYEIYSVVEDYCRTHNHPKKSPQIIRRCLEQEGIEKGKREGRSVFVGLSKRTKTQSRLHKPIASPDIPGFPGVLGYSSHVIEKYIETPRKPGKPGNEKNDNFVKQVSTADIYNFLQKKEKVELKDFLQFDWKIPSVWWDFLIDKGFIDLNGRVFHDRIPKDYVEGD